MMDEGGKYLVRIDGCNSGFGQVRYSFLEGDCEGQTFVISGGGECTSNLKLSKAQRPSIKVQKFG